MLMHVDMGMDDDMEDDTTELWYVNPVTRQLVGKPIRSDVYPGRWRAGVNVPGYGLRFVCVTEDGGEELVDCTQRGTETFRSQAEVERAIARHRVY